MFPGLLLIQSVCKDTHTHTAGWADVHRVRASDIISHVEFNEYNNVKPSAGVMETHQTVKSSQTALITQTDAC